MISRIQWQSPGLFWIAMIALAMVLAAALVFYRPQVRPLWRGAAWVWLLPWLRALALGVLAIALLRPAILTPLGNDDKGIVAVLIDRSQSMNVVDTARPPEQLVRIAAGLGLLDPSARSGDLSELRLRVADLARLADDADRATNELQYARLAGRGIDAANARQRGARSELDANVKVVVESTALPLRQTIATIRADSASQQIPQILRQIDAMQRVADANLYQTNSAVRDICDHLTGESRIGLVCDSLATPAFKTIERQKPVRIFADASSELLPEEFDPANLVADELHTDLVGQLRQLHRRLTGQHVAAVVFFSDGRENNQTSPADALVDWPDVPLIAVDVGSPQPSDLSIEKLDAPASVAAGATVYVQATIHRAGFPAGQAQVILTADQQQQVQRVALAGESTPVEFTFTADHPGACRVTLEVIPQSGEATTANNKVSRMIKVSSDRLKVAVISNPASASQDMEQLRSLLKSTPGFALLDGSIESGKCALSEADLRSADVVVLCDVPLGALDVRQWNAINSAVTHFGRSVVLCAGDPAILASYASQPLVASMLPWRGDGQPAWRTWPSEAPGFRIAPADASEFDAIKLSDHPDVNRLRWNQMPPVARIMSLPPIKPPNVVRVILSDRESALPVLTQMNIGAGRVFFIGTDELSRWRTPPAADSGEQPQFWTALIRTAAHPAYAITDGELAVDADRLLLKPGDLLRVRARAGGAGASLRVERNGSLLQEMSVNAAEAASGGFETVISDLESGGYVLRLIANGREISLPITVAASNEDEMRDISGDSAELERITGSPRAVLSLAELPSLPLRLSQMQIVENHFSEMRLWDSPYLFLFVVACLGVEWAVRKHVGLT